MSPASRRVVEVGWGLALVSGWVAAHLAWAALDRTAPQDDDANLLRMAVCLYHQGGWTVPEACLAGTPYPPLVPLWTALWFGVVGPSVEAAQASLWVFHALAAAALYLAVRREAGVLGATACSAAGLLAWSVGGPCEGYYTEVAMGAFGALALCGWAWSDGGRRAGPLLLVGLALGLGLLSKWSFAFFFGLPGLVWALLAVARAPAGPGPRGALGLAVLGLTGASVGWLVGRVADGPAAGVVGAALLVGLVVGATHPRAARPVAALVLPVALVAGPWYVLRAGAHRAFFASNLGGIYDGAGIPLGVSWPFYPTVLLYALGLPALIAVGLAAGRSAAPGRVPAVSWGLLATALGLLALALAPYRHARYASPALLLLAPAVAVPFAARWVAPWQALLVGMAAWFPFGTLWTGWSPPEPWRTALTQRPYPIGQDARALGRLPAELWPPRVYLPLRRHFVNGQAQDLRGMVGALLADAGPRGVGLLVAGGPNNQALGIGAEVDTAAWPRRVDVQILEAGADLEGRVRATGRYLYLVQERRAGGAPRAEPTGLRLVWRGTGHGVAESLWAPGP